MLPRLQLSKDSANAAAMDKLKVSEQLMDLSMLALQNPGLLVALLADVSKSAPGLVIKRSRNYIKFNFTV